MSSADLAVLVGQVVVSGILLGLNYMLVAISFWLIYATTRTFHLAHAVNYALAGYAMVMVCNWAGLPIWLGLLAGIALAVAASVAMEAIVYAPLRASGASVLGVFLASLGIAIAGPNLIQIIFGPEAFRVANVPNSILNFGGITITALRLTTAVTSLVLALIIHVMLTRSKIGFAISAVRSNPALAMSVGISQARVFRMVFAIGGALIGVAGCFSTMDSAAQATMGLQPVLYGLIGIFLGGTATARGAAFGGFLLGFILVLSGLFLPPDFGVILVFALLAAILIFRPEGLLPARFAVAGEDH
ncbi:branched-chain amino acid ABC transporter permease [Rhizobium lusitanum]|nr:branched-chain amino acid ABC transporter permease [Rhizobium lusitanum]